MDKHNYFDVNIIIRTDEPMTMLELSNHLDKIGLNIIGGNMKMAKEYSDEMYEDAE
jgi:hypothetical protein